MSSVCFICHWTVPANLPNGPCPGLKVPWRQYNAWCPLHINVLLGSQITSLGNTYTMEDVLLMLLEHQSVRIYDQREGHCCWTLGWRLQEYTIAWTFPSSNKQEVGIILISIRKRLAWAWASKAIIVPIKWMISYLVCPSLWFTTCAVIKVIWNTV